MPKVSGARPARVGAGWAITPCSKERSSTVRAIGPTWSREGASGNTPVRGTALADGLSPATPHSAAGIRIEPAVSVPSASGARPRASATAEPPLDPPGTRLGSHGLRIGPAAVPSVVTPPADDAGPGAAG